MQEQDRRESWSTNIKFVLMARLTFGQLAGKGEKIVYRLKVEGTTSVLNLNPRYDTSDELTMYGMHYGLKPTVCTEFVVDVMEMIAKCLQANTKCPRDFARIFAL